MSLRGRLGVLRNSDFARSGTREQRQRGEREREDDAAHDRGPADDRPRAEAPAWSSPATAQHREQQHSPESGDEDRGGVGRRVGPDADPEREAQLGDDQDRPDPAASDRGLDAERRERRLRLVGSRNLERARRDERQRQDQMDRDGDQPMATMRSIGTRARSAIAGSTRISWRRSRRESRSFGSVIIFMYLQKAIRFASIRFACGAAICSG
jgi:hypothetical protein